MRFSAFYNCISFAGNVFVLILSDLIDEIKEKSDSPEQGLKVLDDKGKQQEILSPHMEYISRHVFHSSKNDAQKEKRVSLLLLRNALHTITFFLFKEFLL